MVSMDDDFAEDNEFQCLSSRIEQNYEDEDKKLEEFRFAKRTKN